MARVLYRFMSTPPPGGPPQPQQPNRQPPYPQQPYPPQYPPQQPYYQQPMAPPPKKSNTVLVVVTVVVVVVVALAAVALYAFSLLNPATATATITGVDLTIQYPGSTQYFGTASITTCTNCPLHPSVMSPVAYRFTLTNSDTVAHSITSVTLTSLQFYLASASPNPNTSPVVVPAGGSTTITLNIAATSLSGNGVVTGTIVTT